MASDQEIRRCVEAILLHSPPGAVTSLSAVVSHVESFLGGLDLSHKASFIRDHISLLLFNPRLPNYPYPYPHFHPAPVTAGSSYRPLPPMKPETVKSPVVVESSPAGVKRKGGSGGLSKICGVSPELQAIVGEPTMARTEIVKQLWAYIRKNNLQDPSNRRNIICNDELRLVFETDCTDMFKMNKLLTKHILPLEPEKDSGADSKRLKPTADVSYATNTDANHSPALVSIALADFFGTGEREMLESEALKRLWDYIKANTLQDPVNDMVIVCDSKLQQLFGCETLSSLGISEMLSRHLVRSDS